MQTITCSFFSDGIRLDGLLVLPDDYKPGDRLPTVVLCSGYQGLKELIPAKLWGPLTNASFACFSFDYRGLGTSDGEVGRLLPMEQVEDVRSAVSYLHTRPEIDTSRIALLGWGFGGGVVIEAAADDDRVRAVACLNGIGDAGRAVRTTAPAGCWEEIWRRIGEDRQRRALTGKSALVSPWDVVPIDQETWVEVDRDMYGNHPRFGREVSLRSAEAYYAFRPELVVHRISPRPLLIVHGARNGLHPVEEARSLFARAGEPKELIEVADGAHLDWIQPGHPLYEATIPRIVDWLRRNLGPTKDRDQEPVVEAA
ncbi:MAG TPA: alpha/beta fold hydrolase [Thermomicrobiales bacterium]